MKYKNKFTNLAVIGKSKTRLLTIALAVNLASATLMIAQTPHQGVPFGHIGWNESATLCKLLPGSAASSFYETGGGRSHPALPFFNWWM